MVEVRAYQPTLLVVALAMITCCAALDVVFVALNQVSHVQHARGLAEEMARRGHKVRFALEEEKRSLLEPSEALGVKYLSAGPLPRPENFYNWAKELPDLLKMANDYSISAWGHLYPVLKASPPDLLVFDGIFPIGRALAERLELPSVELAGGSIFLSQLGAEPAWYPALISGLSVEDLDTSFPARLQNSIQRFVLRWGIPLMQAYMYRAFYENAGINPPLYYSSYGHTRLLLSGSPVGLEAPASSSPLIVRTGPWYPRAHGRLDADIEKWTTESAAHGGFVYVSIGTNAEWTDKLIGEFLLGLRRLAPLRVLWSIKAYQQTRYLPNVVGDNIKLVAFADQLAVLKHPQLKAFVTHCGFASFQEAINAEVPMVGMPMMLGSDQPTHAARIRSLGVGVRLHPALDNYTAAGIASAIQEAVHNPKIRENLAKWSAVQRAGGNSHAAADWLERAAQPGGLEHLAEHIPPFAGLDVIGAVVAVLYILKRAFGALLRLCGCRRRSTSSGRKSLLKME